MKTNSTLTATLTERHICAIAEAMATINTSVKALVAIACPPPPSFETMKMRKRRLAKNAYMRAWHKNQKRKAAAEAKAVMLTLKLAKKALEVSASVH